MAWRPSGRGSAPYGVYGHAPPRRAGGGGVRFVAMLGLLALAGVGGAVLLGAMTSRQASSQVMAARQRAAGRDAALSGRLYAAGPLPATGCRGRRIAERDPASFRRFLDATTDCLDTGWRAGLARAGIRFTAPERVFWSVPGRGPCGDYPSPGVAAFYCAANTSMYIGVTDAQRAAGGLPVHFNVAYAREIAHEYGHAVQDLSGILGYSHDARAAAVTKRSELQAQCLSGVFLSSVRESFPVTTEQWSIALRDSYVRGDDARPPGQRDHGTDAHYRGWLQIGFREGTTAACNTWVAPPGDVS
jgi:uncharacterized protein